MCSMLTSIKRGIFQNDRKRKRSDNCVLMVIFWVTLNALFLNLLYYYYSKCIFTMNTKTWKKSAFPQRCKLVLLEHKRELIIVISAG